MKAIVLKDINAVELQDLPAPAKALPGHLLIEMKACAINSGDKLFISGAFPRGIPGSKYNIAGVSGVGKVIEAGNGVPAYHVHFIWELLQNNGKESPVASFMKFTAHEFQSRLKQSAPQVLNEYKVDWHSRDYNFWQPQADWFLLNQVSTIEQKLNYIHLNPMRGKWSLVNDPTEYYYSSCRFYEKGINDFEFLKDYRDWRD